MEATPVSQPSYRRYLLPAFIGIIAGAGLFFALQQNDILYTSIGGVPITTDLSMSDVVISENTEGQIIFTVLKEIPNVQSLSLIVSYDTENITLTPASFSSSLQFDAVPANDNQYVITFPSVGTLAPKTTILTIEANHKSDYLTLSDVVAHFEKYSTALIVSQTE